IGPDPRNFNQRVSLGRNDLLIRTFLSIADALAKPTYLAALSVHVSPARQGIVIGTAQALIAIADFISPVLGGFVLGYALYGVWIGIAISVAIIGLVTAMIYLSKSSVLIVKPETE
ncbi:hypothetical protein AIZ05_22130, partial [Salmonella enterica subsp. enterica serovar Typhimurium]